jgi:hypothetical protein
VRSAKGAGTPKNLEMRRRKKIGGEKFVLAAIGFWLQPYLLSAYYI